VVRTTRQAGIAEPNVAEEFGTRCATLRL